MNHIRHFALSSVNGCVARLMCLFQGRNSLRLGRCRWVYGWKDWRWLHLYVEAITLLYRSCVNRVCLLLRSQFTVWVFNKVFIRLLLASHLNLLVLSVQDVWELLLINNLGRLLKLRKTPKMRMVAINLQLAELDRYLFNELLKLIIVFIEQFVAHFYRDGCWDVFGWVLKVVKHKDKYFLLVLRNFD